MIATFLVATVGLSAWLLDRTTGKPAGPLDSSQPAAAETFLVQQLGSAANLTVTDTDVARLLKSGGHAVPATVEGRVALPSNGVEGQTAAFLHQWPGIYARARFASDDLTVAFDDPFNRYRVSLDGGAGPIIIVTRPGRRALRLSGLGLGHHEVRIDKISESPGVGRFDGFFVSTQGRLSAPPEPMSRQIEFVGDSDSVGYGNLSTSRNCDDVLLLTDTQESFGPQVARHFSADYHLIAVSGIGVVRNYGGGDHDQTMTALYPRVLFESSTNWAQVNWKPQILVLALGSNDFASPFSPTEQWDDQEEMSHDFEAQYLNFLRDLRNDNPDAFLLLLAFEEYGPAYVAAHQSVLRGLGNRADEQVALVTVPKMEKTGCHWHPSRRDHQEVAKMIIQFIESRPQVWSAGLPAPVSSVR